MTASKQEMSVEEILKDYGAAIVDNAIRINANPDYNPRPSHDKAFDKAIEAINTLIETQTDTAYIKGQLQIVKSANCILDAGEPAIDEIWFDYEIDDAVLPMRQDTLTTELEHRLSQQRKPTVREGK